MDVDSAPSLDGLRACFYQKNWHIIAHHLHKAIISFFGAEYLPKNFTHTCLVLIPKIEHPQKFSDLRPISFCDVSCKIISKLLNARSSSNLPRIIYKLKVALSKEGP